jgi:RNA-directed DNA polymerase
MSKETTKKVNPTRILSKAALRDAWQSSRDSTPNPGAHGSDMISARSFAANLDANLTALANDLKLGEFNFSKLRPIPIPKPSSDKERLICVPTVRDRLVQRALAKYLQMDRNRKLLPIYNSSSFGFIPEQGLKKAITKTLELREKFEFVFETDIQKFFDKVKRPELIELLRTTLKGRSILPLMEKVVRTEVKATRFCDKGKLQKMGIENGVGIRQGMPLSPLLANLALSEFDQAIEKAGIPMVRYADDIVTFSNSKAEALEANATIRALLLAQGLTIPDLGDDGKTHISNRHQLPLASLKACMFRGYQAVKLKR